MKRIWCILLAMLLVAFAIPYAADADSFTVTYKTPEGQPEIRLSDADVMTRMTVKKGKLLELTMSDAGAGRTLYLEWYTLPKDAVVEQFDAGGKVISSIPFASPTRYREEIPVDAACKRIALKAKGEACTVSTMFVSETAPAEEYGWLCTEPAVCDMLIVAPSPEYVMETFGPTIAHYAAGHGVKIGIVIMTVGHRYTLKELDRALLKMGVTYAPITLGIDDHNYNAYVDPSKTKDRADQLREIKKCWDEKGSKAEIADIIRRLQPQIVLTVETSDEDVRTLETYTIVKDAVDSVSVKKFYVASASGATKIDCEVPMGTLSGMTAQAFAKEAYRLMDSRGMYRFALPKTPSYRLEKQTVGEDRSGNDLLENIDLSSISGYRDAGFVATQAPVVTAAPVVTEAPAVTEAPTEVPAPVAPVVQAETPKPMIIEEEIVGEEPAAPVATAAPNASGSSQKKNGLFSCGGSKESQVSVEMETPEPTAVPTPVPTAVPTPEPTAVPTDEPTAEPTEEPTPEPTEAPTAEPVEEPTPAASHAYAPTNFDEHFLDEGEPEFVSFDNENGEWIYRSDILAVEITRMTMTGKDGGRTIPVVYFVAHIYERGYDSFRPTFGGWNHDGGKTDKRDDARNMANNAKAVLWITGDNLIHMDTAMKGTLIRDGYMFQKSTRIDSCWLNPKKHTLEIVHKNEMSADELWESGVENCFSFGPTLVENGVVNQKAKDSRREINPRTMIGMIEPGHLIAVVVDGRQPGYSEGLSGIQTAELMGELGCVTAYNLDGGTSATMVFMGVKINRHGTEKYRGAGAKARTMPDGLTWGYSKLVGTFDNMQENNG